VRQRLWHAWDVVVFCPLVDSCFQSFAQIKFLWWLFVTFLDFRPLFRTQYGLIAVRSLFSQTQLWFKNMFYPSNHLKAMWFFPFSTTLLENNFHPITLSSSLAVFSSFRVLVPHSFEQFFSLPFETTAFSRFCSL